MPPAAASVSCTLDMTNATTVVNQRPCIQALRLLRGGLHRRGPLTGGTVPLELELPAPGHAQVGVGLVTTGYIPAFKEHAPEHRWHACHDHRRADFHRSDINQIFPASEFQRHR